MAQTEILEHRRQPWMLLAMSTGYILVVGFAWWAFGAMDSVAADPAQLAQLNAQLQTFGMASPGQTGDTSLRAMVGAVLPGYLALLVTNMPIFVAYFAGYSMIHDRESGVLPFVLLSPLSRGQMLVGKLMGLMAIPMMMHVVGTMLGCLPLMNLEIVATHQALVGGDISWWVLVLGVTPCFALFIGALGTVISALVRDVRASMQIMSLCFWLLSLGFNMAVVYSVRPEGLGQLVGFAVASLVACIITLAVGSQVMARDLGR
ncbi:MAG: ABC transporter permease subunit [Myxococcota bacterium]